jgi:hypothetical protein
MLLALLIIGSTIVSISDSSDQLRPSMASRAGQTTADPAQQSLAPAFECEHFADEPDPRGQSVQKLLKARAATSGTATTSR